MDSDPAGITGAQNLLQLQGILDFTVGFQMDCDHVFRHLDRGMQCTMDYRSIVGTGTISFVEDRAEFEKATRLLLEHHGSPEGFVVTDAHFKATTILKLTAHSFTGKKKTPFN